MRYGFSFGLALALSLALTAGCSDENGGGGSGGTAGTGAVAGTGGTGGEGGSGGTALSDCTGAEDGTECVYGDAAMKKPMTSGLCVSEVCFVDDCVAYIEPSEPVPLSGVNCVGSADMDEFFGLCVDGTCVAPQDDCTDQPNGTPCWFDEGRSEMGMCDEVGNCLQSAAPNIGFVSWDWGDDCDANTPGQVLHVLIAADDPDTPWDQLRYSGQVQDCAPDLNAFETTLSCDVYLGARPSEAIVTDPQGNQDTMFFAPDPCAVGCEGSCPK